ncbi:hypothetical protein CEUSTIGMA_g1782.t1 [Chlamydomonas eustigma]|uniref:Uncharacterized protein n=1 Tax=Chlamydomonas eustigma TaxID=1157962 RepID=A0A250WU32_9CHLO|nr:hypothetical protein CEUSTIGMA_g1782.t1 [Chlamydomonas eustigma]|eukprot:GAX74333.1 hypothetical protein CEUSTIGMA_g1782.t1 [Chlamydomonas eustigma]
MEDDFYVLTEDCIADSCSDGGRDSNDTSDTEAESSASSLVVIRLKKDSGLMQQHLLLSGGSLRPQTPVITLSAAVAAAASSSGTSRPSGLAGSHYEVSQQYNEEVAASMFHGSSASGLLSAAGGAADDALALQILHNDLMSTTSRLSSAVQNQQNLRHHNIQSSTNASPLLDSSDIITVIVCPLPDERSSMEVESVADVADVADAVQTEGGSDTVTSPVGYHNNVADDDGMDKGNDESVCSHRDVGDYDYWEGPEAAWAHGEGSHGGWEVHEQAAWAHGEGSHGGWEVPEATSDAACVHEEKSIANMSIEEMVEHIQYLEEDRDMLVEKLLEAGTFISSLNMQLQQVGSAHNATRSLLQQLLLLDHAAAAAATAAGGDEVPSSSSSLCLNNNSYYCEEEGEAAAHLHAAVMKKLHSVPPCPPDHHDVPAVLDTGGPASGVLQDEMQCLLISSSDYSLYIRPPSSLLLPELILPLLRTSCTTAGREIKQPGGKQAVFISTTVLGAAAKEQEPLDRDNDDEDGQQDTYILGPSSPSAAAPVASPAIVNMMDLGRAPLFCSWKRLSPEMLIMTWPSPVMIALLVHLAAALQLILLITVLHPILLSTCFPVMSRSSGLTSNLSRETKGIISLIHNHHPGMMMMQHSPPAVQVGNLLVGMMQNHSPPAVQVGNFLVVGMMQQQHSSHHLLWPYAVPACSTAFQALRQSHLLPSVVASSTALQALHSHMLPSAVPASSTALQALQSHLLWPSAVASSTTALQQALQSHLEPSAVASCTALIAVQALHNLQLMNMMPTSLWSCKESSLKWTEQQQQQQQCTLPAIMHHTVPHLRTPQFMISSLSAARSSSLSKQITRLWRPSMKAMLLSATATATATNRLKTDSDSSSSLLSMIIADVPKISPASSSSGAIFKRVVIQHPSIIGTSLKLWIDDISGGRMANALMIPHLPGMMEQQPWAKLTMPPQPLALRHPTGKYTTSATIITAVVATGMHHNCNE